MKSISKIFLLLVVGFLFAACFPFGTPYLVKISILAEINQIAVGETTLIQVWAEFSNFSGSDVTSSSTLTVSDNSLASINSSGLFTPLIAGSVEITARYSGQVATRSITITGGGASPGLTVDPTTGLETGEDGSTAQFTVVLNTQPSSNVIVPLSSDNENEGTVFPVQLIFTNANWDTTQTVTVTGQDDVAQDGDVAYSITVGPTEFSSDYLGFTEIVEITNLDNDSSGPIIVTPPAFPGLYEQNENSIEIDVTLASNPSDDVSITFTSSDPSEGLLYTYDDGTLLTSVTITITPALWSIGKTVLVQAVDDVDLDGDVEFTVEIAPSVSLDAAFNDVDPADLTFTNYDNEFAGAGSVTVTPTSISTGESGANGTFTVVLDTVPAANVTITAQIEDSTEGDIVGFGHSRVLTFTTLNWDTAQTVEINGKNDSIDDDDVTYYVFLQPTVSSDVEYDGFDPIDVSVTNVDDDTVGVSVSNASPSVAEGSNNMINFALNSEPTAPVTIEITAVDTGEVLISGGDQPSPATSLVLTFDSADYNENITIWGQQDNVVDGPGSSNLLVGDPSSTDLKYDGLAHGLSVVVTVPDTTTPGVTVDPTSGLVTTEAAGQAVFTVVLDSIPDGNVVIDVASDNLNEGTTDLSSLAFNASNWDTAQPVTITGEDDAVPDADIAYTILLTINGGSTTDTTGYASLDPDDVTVVNENDEIQTEVYVKTDGDDANYGSEIDPKLTIAAALIEAASKGIGEIRVAGGIYEISSSISINQDVSLLGGYNPADWGTRDSDIHTTTIADSTVAGGTFSSPVRAVAIGDGLTVIIDGFVIIAATGPAYTAGIVLGASNTTVSNSGIKGGEATTNTFSIFRSGNSTGAIPVPSIIIDNSWIDPGNAGSNTSYGIYIHLSPDTNPFDITITNNAISGLAPDSGTVRGITFGNSKSFEDLTSTIAYNTISFDDQVNLTNAVGIQPKGPSVIYNNIIRIKTDKYATGIDVSDAAPAPGPDYVQILNNTIIADGGLSGGSASGIFVNGANPRIEHNILDVGTSASSEFAIEEYTANSDPQSLLYNDLYVGGQLSVYFDFDGGATGDGDGDADSQTASLSDINGLTDFGVSPAGNVVDDPLLDVDGYLTAGSLLSVTEGGDAATVAGYPFTDDIDGTPRTDPWSMGAHEY